jgi:hypothetical protein
MKITQELLLYPFHDEDWIKKVVIYGLVMFLGIFIIPLPLLGGYGLRLLRGVVETGEPRLPEWDDFGDLYRDGLAQIVISIVYGLPLYILLCGAMVPLFGAPFAMATADNAPGLAVGGMIVGYGLAFGLIGLASLIGLFVSFILYVALARYVDTGDLGSAFRFREVWDTLKANLGHFALAFAVYYGLSAGLGFAMQILMYTIVLICILPFVMVVATFYGQALMGALYGLAYREAREKLDAAPSEAAADEPLPGMTGE